MDPKGGNYYCTVRCPAGIKITDLMYELKRMAIKYDLAPKDGKSPAMTKYFVDSVHKHGRNHEVELMAKFMLTKDWGLPFKFMGTGLKLFTAGRLPLFAKNIRGREELDKISAYLEAQEAKRGLLQDAVRKTGESSGTIRKSAEGQRRNAMEIGGAMRELEKVSQTNKGTVDALRKLTEAYGKPR